MTDLVTPAPEIPRDRWGRPLVVPPNGGKPVAYTRCTTYIDCLEDKFNLQKWMQRQVAIGLSLRPDLQLQVASIGDPGDDRGKKSDLDRACDAAREAAGSSTKATTGTALHALTELVDRGQDLPPLPDSAKADLEAYKAATASLTSTHIEQFCVLDPLQIGGTPDRVVEVGGRRFIADIKTGSIEYGALKIAMQLSIYSRSRTYDIATGERGLHEAETGRGLIIHLPAGQATCTLHWVDLSAGWEAVQVAKNVRRMRKHKLADLTEPYEAGVDVRPSLRLEKRDAERDANADAARLAAIERQLLAAPTREAALAVWEANGDIWNDHLTDVATRHVANLPAAV